MDADEIARALRRIAGEITERNRGTHELCLVGIRRGGVSIAQRLQVLLTELEGREVQLGTVDINLYRDDLDTAHAAPVVGRSDIAFSLEHKIILLVDDVLFTGRTVRAAIDALMDYGRPKAIQLCTLVDRGHRELPISADYVGRVITTAYSERVDVTVDATDPSHDRAELIATDERTS